MSINPLTINQKHKAAVLYLSAFLLPFLLFLSLCAALGCAPFGSLSMLDMDAPGQYVPIFSAVHEIASGDADLSYTFCKSLGGDMISLLAYYLLSPLNLLLLLFSKAQVPLALTLIIGLKLALCGLTSAVFFVHTGRKDFGVLAFSTAYALMSYNIVYSSNLIWLDGVYILPIVALGLFRLVKGKSPVMYILALAYGLFTNYYIGYMLCLFSVAVFAAVFLSRLGSRPGLFRITLRYAFSSLLAGGLAAVVLIPCFLSLSGTKANVDGGRLGMYLMYPFRDMLSMLFPRSFQTENMLTGLPFLYCGTLSLVCVLLYFVNGSIPRKNRIISLLFLLAMLFSFNVNGLYVTWHGFSYPTGFPYRNAFLLSFVLLHLGWQGWCNRAGLSTHTHTAGLVQCAGLSGHRFLIAGFLALAAFLLLRPFSSYFLKPAAILLGAVLAALCLLLLFAARIPRRRSWLSALLVLLQIVTMFDNALYLKKQFVMYYDSQAFAADTSAAEGQIQWIRLQDDSFYRVANTQGSQNEPIQLGYYGLAHFSSTEKTQVKRFLHALGFSSYADYWVWYQEGSTASADALLSVKYILSPNAPQKDYPLLQSGSQASIFRNPNALDLAFPADDQVLQSLSEPEDIFLYQNQIWSALMGEELQLFRSPQAVEITLENLTESGENAHRCYQPVAPEKPSEICYSFTAESDQPLYLYCSAPGDKEISLYLNGSYHGDCLGIYNHRVIPLGRFTPGEHVTVCLRWDSGPLYLTNSYLAYEDLDLLHDCCRKIQSNDSKTQLLRPSRIQWEGSVTEENQVLLLSIPYEAGWSVRVDGSPASLLPALGVLSAVPLDPGQHSVLLSYTPPGLPLGMTVSLLSAAILVGYLLLLRRKSSR